MNNKYIENLKLLAGKYDHICVDVETFTDLLAEEYPTFLEPFTDRETLRSGKYAKIFGKVLCVSYIVPSNCVMVSNKENPNTKNPSDWSPAIELENADKLDI